LRGEHRCFSKQFYATGAQRLTHNYKKCVDNEGEIEKNNLKFVKNLSSPLFIQLNVQLNCSKGMLKIYIKIYNKSAPTCFGLITIIRDLTVCTLLKL
jgi:hypothetical protein